MEILTVDDDEIALEMLNMALTQAGYEVISARNGRQAMDILRSGRCRMVITDWEMPVMNGLELCQAIREEDLPGYVYAIILTGHGSHEEAVEGLSAGADDFISKPFNPAELAVRIRCGERILSLETRDVAIFAMAKLAESRDPETGAHLERVRTYARVISLWLANQHRAGYEVDASFVRTIYQTSPLHDIGKIGIPDSVLLKPGRLSDREFETMKTHTVLGAETLNAALEQFPDAKFLLMARDIAQSHHERFDGSGYPDGLAGRNIPLAGRIVALADVYDALTSKRIYKNAFNHDVARSIINDESGSHFDPVIVEAFMVAEQEFIKIRDMFAEVAVAV
jgi:putative two-component system response regulator